MKTGIYRTGDIVQVLDCWDKRISRKLGIVIDTIHPGPIPEPGEQRDRYRMDWGRVAVEGKMYELYTTEIERVTDDWNAT